MTRRLECSQRDRSAQRSISAFHFPISEKRRAFPPCGAMRSTKKIRGRVAAGCRFRTAPFVVFRPAGARPQRPIAAPRCAARLLLSIRHDKET